MGDNAVDAYIESGAVDKYVAENIERCTVILAAGRIVGYSVCRENLIDLMMIDYDCHRRGLGSALLEHVEKTLFEKYDELTLESFEDNEKANNFYRKHGWREVKQRFDEESGVNKIVFGKAA